jgi:hypothetical protein
MPAGSLSPSEESIRPWSNKCRRSSLPTEWDRGSVSKLLSVTQLVRVLSVPPVASAVVLIPRILSFDLALYVTCCRASLTELCPVEVRFRIPASVRSSRVSERDAPAFEDGFARCCPPNADWTRAGICSNRSPKGRERMPDRLGKVSPWHRRWNVGLGTRQRARALPRRSDGRGRTCAQSSDAER